MARRDFDYLIIAAMLLASLYILISGLVMDVFGLHRFAYHNYAGYAWATLGITHVTLNGRRIITYLRHTMRVSSTKETSAMGDIKPSLARREFLISILSAAVGFILGWLIPNRRMVQLPGETQADVPHGDIGQFYHRWSKPSSALLLGNLQKWGERPEPYKTYPDAQRITLPPSHGNGRLSLEEAIGARRSIRDYAAGSLTLEELSRLLHAAQGITDPMREFRTAPSAGALYPIETYILVHDVSNLESGLYHYAVADHALEQLRTGNLRTQILVAGLGQEMLAEAQLCLALSAIFQRTRWRYHERTYRYVMLEAGHIGQNIYLAATSMGLGCCAVGAFLDDELNGLLGLDGENEAAVYLFSVGKS
jgi:SagB-type dehydrogenase family enzyme